MPSKNRHNRRPKKPAGPASPSESLLRQKTPPLVPAAAGFLVLSDVIRFSVLPRKDQQHIVENLWSFLASDPLIARDNDQFYNGTGDGALIAFPNNGKQVTHDEVVGLCDRMHQALRVSAPSCQLRVAVHQGPFHPVKITLGTFESIQVVGNGPNEVARVVGFAGPGQTVVTEPFVRSWVDLEGDEVLDRFHPGRGKDPITVAVKHDRPLQIRVSPPSASGTPSPQLKKLSVIETRLRRVLEEIDKYLSAGLDALSRQHGNGQLTPNDISARVSFFVPVHQKPRSELKCTSYRHHLKKEAVTRSNTRYGFAPDDPSQAEGPIARAFVTRTCQVVAGLPDPAAAPEAYRLALTGEGIPVDTVANFGRPARAFFAVPCFLPDHEPDVVICIDTSHPIDLPRPELQKWAEKVETEFSELVAVLWRIRY